MPEESVLKKFKIKILKKNSGKSQNKSTREKSQNKCDNENAEEKSLEKVKIKMLKIKCDFF